MTPVRAIRRRAGLTMQGLAELLGVDRTSVWRWETGQWPVPRSPAIVLEMLDAGELPERYR